MMMFRQSEEEDIAAHHHQQKDDNGAGSNSGFESSDGYWAKRKKNNEAARRSREKRRLNDMMMEKRMMQLTEENKKLKTQLWTIQIKYGETQESATYPSPNVQYANEAPNQVSKPGGFTSKFFTNSCGDTSAKVIIKTSASRATENSVKKHSTHYQTAAGVTATNEHHHMSDHDKIMCHPLSETSANMILPSSHPPSPNHQDPEMKTYQNMMSNPLQHLHVGHNLYSNPFNYQALMNGFIQSATSCPDIPTHFALPSMYPLDLRQPTTQHRGDDIMTSSMDSSVHELSETKRRRRSIHHHHHRQSPPTPSYQPPTSHYDVINNSATAPMRSNRFHSGSDSSVTTASSPRNSPPLSDVLSNAGSDESGASSKGGSESGSHLPLKLRFKRKATDGSR